MAHDYPVSDKPRPLQAMDMLLAGYTTREVATWMKVEQQTIRSYISRARNWESYRESVKTYQFHYAKGPRQTAWTTQKSWTDAELCERLTQLWNEGFSAGKIASMVPFRGKFTRNAIIGKANRLGLVGKGKRKAPSVKEGYAFPRGPKGKMWEVEL